MKVSELNGDFKGTFSDPPAGTIPGDTAGETISYTIFRESTPDPIGVLWVTPRGLGGFIPTESTGMEGVGRSWGWNRELSYAQVAAYERGETFDGLAWLKKWTDQTSPMVYQVDGPYTIGTYDELHEMFSDL